MNSTESEPFYIGYQPQAPAGLRRWLLAVIVALLTTAVIVALLLATGFQRLPLSVFEFGQEREYTGVILRTQPYPSLLVKNNDKLEQYWLVGSGKHAADISAFVGQTVKLRGALITRDELRMLEINPSNIERLSESSIALPNESLGRFTFIGEIVDSKCYLGVMNPGHTKPHRECAVRCISGGVPPLFVARDANRQEVTMQLANAAGEPLSKEILDFVAEPVEISGDLTRTGEWFTLRADPATYRRLP